MDKKNVFIALFVILVVCPTHILGKSSNLWDDVMSYVNRNPWTVVLAAAPIVETIISFDRSTEVIILNLSDKDFVISYIKCEAGVFDIMKKPPMKIYQFSQVTYTVASNRYFGGASCKVAYADSNTHAVFIFSTENGYFDKSSAKENHDDMLGITIEYDVGLGWNNQVTAVIRNI